MQCLFIQVERLVHQKARTYKLEDCYRDFFTGLFIRGCLRYDNNVRNNAMPGGTGLR